MTTNHIPCISHVQAHLNCTHVDYLNSIDCSPSSSRDFISAISIPRTLDYQIPIFSSSPNFCSKSFLNSDTFVSTCFCNLKNCNCMISLPNTCLTDHNSVPITSLNSSCSSFLYDSHAVFNYNVHNNNVPLPDSNLEPVINLSSFQLTPAMISLLSKGLNFCPTPSTPDRSELRRDLDKFHTSLRRKQFFERGILSTQDLNSTDTTLTSTPLDEEEVGPFDHFKFRKPSSWSPQGPLPLESFITLNEFALNKCTLTAPPRQNFSSDEKRALAELSEAHNIIIKPADKGSAVVIQNLEDYIAEGHRQLSNPNFYVETPIDLTHLHNEHITNLVTYLNSDHQISDKCRSYLSNESPRTPQLYLLPKIHKNQSPVPGRPIVSANNSPSERISQFADFFLQPLVKTTRSYIKDTTDFINHIEAIPPLPDDSLLCTIDVCSLYTNIPNDEGISACKIILDKYRRTNNSPTNQSITDCLTHVLYMNNFDFNGKHYLQVGGTAMGTKVAPSFANIFMAHFEDTHVYTYHTQPLIWLRYIDDIFMVWDKGRNSLDDFLQHLNSCHKTIKFTSDISNEKIHFLDTTVQFNDSRTLYTDLYCKPTDSHNYLLYNSAHPKHLKNSLPYSQLLRLRRICTKIEDFDRNALNLNSHFLRRQYPPTLIQEAIAKARSRNREDLLNPQTPPEKKDTNADLFLISTFNPTSSPLKEVIDSNWPLLGRTITTETIYSKKVTFGYRRNKSLRDTLVHAKIPPEPKDRTLLLSRSHNRRCIAKICRYCPKLDRSGRITCTTTGKKHASKHNITCNSNNLIYCITCKRCSNQYVGQTKNSIKERFKCHFFSVTQPTKSNTAVGRHFSAPDHQGLSDITIHILDFMSSPSQSPASQRQRDDLEKMWIHKLVSTAPYGLNVVD